MKRTLILFSIIGLAILLRIYGLNWDQGTHLHPDERFLTMVATSARLPASLTQYLDPRQSTLNPYNIGYDFYVYGTFPLTLVKSLAVSLDYDNYAQLTLLGRAVSALIDVLILIIVFVLSKLITRRLGLEDTISYYATFLYAVTVFAIQQAHYFTVDPFTALLTLLSIYTAFLYYENKRNVSVILSAIFFGLAVGSKLSSVYFLPLTVGLIGFSFSGSVWQKVRKGVLLSLITAPAVYMSLRLADPRLFETANWLDLTINKQFVENIKQLAALNTEEALFPPGIQWLSSTPVLTPLKDIIFFGLGPVYAVLVIIGVFIILNSLRLKKEQWRALSPIIWLFICLAAIFIYQGIQFSKTMRYFYTFYPFFAFFGAVGLSVIFRYKKWLGTLALFGVILYPMAFMNIYSQPHSRVSASKFIYEQLPNGSTIASEHWDDGLPLGLPINTQKQFNSLQLPVFAKDRPEKWQQMKNILTQADYYVLSSNRGYGSILKVPDRFPLMSQFYTDLFAGNTEFQLVAEFTVYPQLCMPMKRDLCYSIVDDWADEAFSVYDHPKVSIFKKL